MELKKLLSQKTLQKLLLLALLVVAPATVLAQSGMTDDQVVELITNEMKAGRTQSQIVATLIQRGVRVDQIRRIRQQYSSQLNKRGLSGAADNAVSSVEDRMRSNNGKPNTMGRNAERRQDDMNIQQDLNTGYVASAGNRSVNNIDLQYRRLLFWLARSARAELPCEV